MKRDVYTVSRLNREARRLLETGLPMLWVEGELSNLAQPASGHWYFSLKDADAQIRCAMFRGRNRAVRVAPRNGLKVVVRGRVSLYEPRGDFQFIAENMTEAGEGSLQRAFEALKAKLDAEGLFASAHKRPLPTLPRRVGVITSPTGAAVRDILHVLGRRFPSMDVRIYPVPVQGEQAAPAIVAALALAGERADCDVLIVARGGGSLEDLWPFNDEAVARAVHACPIPVVSAVGHETDVTICDFVADVRAPTPSAAAELVVPDARTLLRGVRDTAARLTRALERTLHEARRSLQWVATRHRNQHPGLLVAQLAQRLDNAERRLDAAVNARLLAARARLHRRGDALRLHSPRRRLEALRARAARAHLGLDAALRESLRDARYRLAGAARTLDTVGPRATLERGYAIVSTPDGKVLRDATAAAPGGALRVRLAHGALDADVTAIHPEDTS